MYFVENPQRSYGFVFHICEYSCSQAVDFRSWFAYNKAQFRWDNPNRREETALMCSSASFQTANDSCAFSATASSAAVVSSCAGTASAAMVLLLDATFVASIFVALILAGLLGLAVISISLLGLALILAPAPLCMLIRRRPA